MTLDQAQALSRALAEASISHTVQVGYHEDLMPQVQCRVDLPIPRRYETGLAAAIERLEQIGREHGLVLCTSIMGDGLTYSTPGRTPGALLKGTQP